MIDVSHLDLCELIEKLWYNVKPSRFCYSCKWEPQETITREEIQEALNFRPFINHLCGRYIKVDFYDLKHVATRMYNQMAGERAFEKIVGELNEKEKI